MNRSPFRKYSDFSTYCGLKRSQTNNSRPNLTVFGKIDYRFGATLLPTIFINGMNKECKVNFFSNAFIEKSVSDQPDIYPSISDIYKDFYDKNKTYGNVCINFEPLVCDYEGVVAFGRNAPADSIRYAYVYTETTLLCKKHIDALNENYDACIISDPFLEQVYRDSGLIIPTFQCPAPIDLKWYLERQQPKRPRQPFVFGVLTPFELRKNHDLLFRAFIEEFGNDPNVILKISGNYNDSQIFENLNFKIKDIGINNVYLFHQSLNMQEKETFLTSLDCFVFLSRAEGFSIVPREAMALGIPCIISDHTALSTIVNTGHVKGIKPTIIEQDLDRKRHPEYAGKWFNCHINDVRKALRDVYNNYSDYIQRAQEGRVWCEQFQTDRWKKNYLSLLRPKEIILGRQNTINGESLMTDSIKLYEKYIQLIQKNEAKQ